MSIMRIDVHYPAEWHTGTFLEEYDKFIESTGLTEYAFGYALARTHIDITPAVVEFFKFILDNRYLFVKVEEAENAK